MERITVFGATGKIGSELIWLLSQAGVPVVAVTRDLAKAVRLPLVEWVQADIANEWSLAATMKGSGKVFLLSGYGPHFAGEQQNVIRVAGTLGVRHIVKLSSGAVDKDSPLHIPRAHGQVEDALITSGIHYTMLRPNGIMQNWLGEIADEVRTSRRFHEATGDGRRAHVDRRDIAEVAFRCLIESEKHYDKIYLLTSDRAVNYFDVARAIGSAIGETVEYSPISLDQARTAMEAKGMPAALVDTFLSYDEAQLNGGSEIVSDAVRTVLGKPARTLENFAIDYASFFR